MAWKKYIKKGAKKATRFAKKRYTTRTNNLRINRLAKDMYRIQRSLNVEHKHIDWKFGSSGQISAQKPTKNTPLIFQLPTPMRGTGYDNRVGNQIRITHMTAKFQLAYHNNTDLIQRQNVRARIIFAKDAGDVPVISNLLHQDANGHYTDLSFVNGQEYKKYLWIKALDMRHGYTQPTNRYPPSNTGGTTANPNSDGNGGIGGGSGSGTIDVDSVASKALNVASFFKRLETKCSIKMMFANGTDTVEQMQPYLVLTSDVIENNAGDDYDFITVSGQIRMTYVDN